MVCAVAGSVTGCWTGLCASLRIPSTAVLTLCCPGPSWLSTGQASLQKLKLQGFVPHGHAFLSTCFISYCMQLAVQAFHGAPLLPGGPEPKPALMLSGSSLPNQPALHAWCVIPTQAPQSWIESAWGLQVLGGKDTLWHGHSANPVVSHSQHKPKVNSTL